MARSRKLSLCMTLLCRTEYFRFVSLSPLISPFAFNFQAFPNQLERKLHAFFFHFTVCFESFKKWQSLTREKKATVVFCCPHSSPPLDTQELARVSHEARLLGVS